MAEPTEKKKSSCGCCFLKIVGVIVLLSLVVGVIVGINAIKTKKWMESAEEAQPASYTPLRISAGEQEDVDRVIQVIHRAQADKKLVDETISPNVFNGVVNAIIEGEKAKGKSPELDPLRLSIDGDHFNVAATARIKGKNKFANIEAVFDFEVEEGKITKLDVHKIVAGGNEAPFVVKTGIGVMIAGFKKGINENTTPEARKFRGFRLVKREGDRIHIVIDPNEFDPPEKDVAAPKPEGAKESF